MNLNWKKDRSVPFLLSLLLIIQSCQVYKTSSITLEEAALKREKVRVVTPDEGKLKFKYIDKIEGVYYGVKKKKGEIVKTPLNQEYVVGIYPKDKTLTAITAMSFSALIIGMIFLMVSSFSITPFK